MSKVVLEEIKKLNKEKCGIFETLIHRHISTRITSILVNTKVDPNMVTLFSVILALISAVFFLKADHLSLVIGSLFLNLSYVFDCVDGELARYKKLNSNFGAWWDSICDRISECAVFTGLMLGLYFKTLDHKVLIVGFFALVNLLMIANVRSLSRCYIDTKLDHEFCFFGKYYIGRIDFVITLITVASLLNQIYYFLLIFAILGTVIWIRQIYRKIMLNCKN